MIEKSKAKKHGVKILDNSEQNKFFENLKSNFPQTIKDGHADLKAISLLLGIDNKADVSGYELTWTGKGLSNAMYSFPCNKELRLDEIYSANSNNPKNIIIRGDNIDALKILKSAYSEKIKMIYIDPPYNTANDNFIYPDNFREDYKAILREVGLIEIDENGAEIESENLRFFKNIQSSRTHSGWLSFMLPRLKLARDLLKDDGVIFISIDDNEQANLKILCDEIFGEDNFVACMPRITKKAGKSTDKVANNHDYVLCYSKNDITFKQIEVNEENYKEKDKYFEERGGYKLNQTLDYDSLQYSKKMDFEVEIDGIKYYPGGYEKFLERKNGKFGRIDWVWRWSKDKFIFGLENDFIEIRNNRIYTKTYFKAKISDKKPYNIEYIDRTKNVSSIELLENKYSNDSANKNLQEIFGQKNIFDYSKSAELITFLISQISTSANKSMQGVTTPCYQGSGDAKNNNNEASAHCVQSQSKALKVAEPTINETNQKVDCHADKSARNDNLYLRHCERSEAIHNNAEPDIILDFFAGSGTTAQAVMELNAEDGGNRQFILVQIDEEIKEEKSKSAYDFCKKELKSEKPAISDITIERVKRAVEKIIQSVIANDNEAINKKVDCHANARSRRDAFGDDNTNYNEAIQNIGFTVFTLSDKPEIIINEEKSLELVSQRNLNKIDIITNMAITNGKTLDKKFETIFDGKLYKCEDSFYLIECDKEILKYLTKTQNEYILIDAYGDIELEDFLNLGAGFKERLRVVY